MWVTVSTGEGSGLGVKVEGERFLVGTAPECQLMIGDPKTSPLHAYFEVRPDGHVLIRDLGSEHGTYVNGERIDGARRITGDEQIRVGDTILIPSVADPQEEARRVSHDDAPFVRVEQKGRSVEIVPERDAEDGEAVLVATEGEAVEVVGAGERRRLRVRSRIAIAAAGLAAAAAIAAILVAVLDAGGGRTTADIVRYARPRTVLVRALLGRGVSSGSGVVLEAASGLVITNFHVVNGGTAFEVGFHGDLRPATVVGAAPCDDLAVLQVSSTNGLQSFQLGSQSSLSEGDRVVAVGYPGNASLDTNLTSTDGVVSQVRTTFRAGELDAPQYPDHVQTTAPLAPGNSGGPLIDSRERVVGINTGVLQEVGGAPVQGQGYAIGVDRLKQVVPRLAAGHSIGWPGFGLAAAPKADLLRRRLPVGVIAGPPVPGTPAAATQLAGAVITQLNGYPLDGSLTSYCNAARTVASGQTAVLTVVARPGAAAREVPVRFP